MVERADELHIALKSIKGLQGRWIYSHK